MSNSANSASSPVSHNTYFEGMVQSLGPTLSEVCNFRLLCR